MARRYEMSGRSAAMQRTRESILDAAIELFGSSWYDEVTLGDVAKRAGVSQQTVVNHFGSKVGLYLTGIRERFAPAITRVRSRAVPGDVGSIVATAVEDYETTGEGTFRNVVLAERLEELESLVAGGRRAHAEWVEQVFTPQLEHVRGARRDRMLRLLGSVLDVSMWKRLRRDEGLDAEATTDHLRVLVEGVLATVDA